MDISMPNDKHHNGLVQVFDHIEHKSDTNKASHLSQMWWDKLIDM